MYQRGIVHLLPLILIVVAVAVGAFLFSQGKLKIPSFQKGPKVELQTSYENPFKKETQFVNPFETYKNPFVVNR